MFSPNLARWDRLVRVVLGVVLIALPYLVGAPLLANAWTAWGMPIAGVILIGTAAFSFCPIYAALGVSTKNRSVKP